jgi:hypothetical protein
VLGLGAILSIFWFREKPNSPIVEPVAPSSQPSAGKPSGPRATSPVARQPEPDDTRDMIRIDSDGKTIYSDAKAPLDLRLPD